MNHLAKRAIWALTIACTAVGLGGLAVAGPAAGDSAPSATVAVQPTVPGPPGYAMAAPTGAVVNHALAAPGAPVNASYTHTPAPSSQPDLPAGGPTMHTLTIYEVFWLPSGHYGSSAADDTAYENLLQQFAGDLNGSPYYNLVTQYYDTTNSNTHITNSASFGGAFVDTSTAYPHAGTTSDPLLEGDVRDEVAHAVATQGWTEDINHIVAVFTAKDIQECDASGMTDGHCTFPVSPSSHGEFCAYHSHFSDSGTDTLFAYMSYDDQFHGSGQTCVAGNTGGDTDPHRFTYPNGSMGADAEVSTLSHEIIEAVTDPHPNAAWTASDGEIGDKCNFNYTPRADNGADVYLNGHPYIVQQEYSNAVHTCAIDLCGSGVCAPSVSFSKNVDDATPEVSRSATYTVSMNNTNDTGAATNLSFTDTVPSGYVITSVSAPSSTSQNHTSTTVTVAYDTLAVHQSRSVSIEVTVPPQAGVTATNCGGLALQDLLGAALTSLTTNPCASTTPELVPTTLTYTGATTQDYNDPATVSARLTDDQSYGVNGETVSFTLNGVETCNGTTDSFGDASCTITPGEAAGSYTLEVSFGATDTYAASSTSTTFVVTREETSLSYTGPTLVANNMPATLSGVLLEDGTTPISGRDVTLTLGAGGSAQSCTGTTDTTGTATCTIANVSQPAGPGTASADFAGDAYYLPASDSATTIVFAYTDGGSFVVGDAAVGPIGSAVGQHVSYWGSQWAKTNTLSSGDAPSSFTGFANDPVLPDVGTPWMSKGGSSNPPPATVPSYTAMIVTSSVVKSGNTIGGDDVHIVIVQTDPGYSPDAGHMATGTIVAVLA